MKCKLFLLFSFFVFGVNNCIAQNATLQGKITDAANGEALPDVNVVIKGTSKGATSDDSGIFKIEDIKPGEYDFEASYIGYQKVLQTGIKLKSGESRTLNFSLKETSLTIDQEIVIIGTKPLVDVEEAKTNRKLDAEVIAAAPTRPIQQILNTQTGVVQNPEGITIRGGRTYETGFYIDGLSATDPMAGTGFGIDIGSNAISNVEVTTGGAGAEYGDATAGVVNTQTKSGGDKFSIDFMHKRDNLGFNKNAKSTWNHQVYELGFGGPIKPFEKLNKNHKVRYFISAKNTYSDEFINQPATQVVSSIYKEKYFSPFQDNRMALMAKLNYDFKPTMKLSFTYLKSLNINQNSNMLRITGNDVSFYPGYQFAFWENPDNANTYTHDTNMEAISWQHTPSQKWSYKITLSRFFVHLRSDANGRAWRPEEVDTELDPRSITGFNAGYFNPNDSIIFVNAASGFYNNGGIATLWHDHYLEEYNLKFSGNLYSKNTFNRLNYGAEWKTQAMQWIDIYRPWIGAPITLNDGTVTQSFRLGDASDIWRVYPFRGSVFVSDKIKFRGLVADIGLRAEYWLPGKFVDDAIANPDAPIRNELKSEFLKNSFSIAGRSVKMRILPKISASFPVSENQVMFFNYSHSMVQPHPSYIYAGLDPFYTDRSTLSRLGNPDLNPEVDISYELGFKSQITSNDALNISAYWKDKYDFITTTTILLKDATGRDVSRTIKVNGDYARVRGVEVSYLKRVAKWFTGSLSAAYSLATGQSNSASDAIKDIQQTGVRQSTKEQPLAWDSPLDLKAFSLFTLDNKEGFFNKKWMNKMSAYIDATFRTGRRYAPYILTGYETTGRPIYEQDPVIENRYSKISVPTFTMNLNFKKWWMVKGNQLALSLEITNLLNNKNSQIINPITGKAYRLGDDVPTEWKDIRYNDPRDPRSSNLTPLDPSRYAKPRHIMLGFSIKI